MRKSKLIVPIVVTIMVVLYFILYFGFIIYVIDPNICITTLGAIMPPGLSIAMICVAIQRIKEIRSGEEDDLSKY